MLVTVGVLTAVAMTAVAGATMLASAAWPGRAPAAAILLWQALGLGWGLVGICPGPAIVNLAGLGLPMTVFVAAMIFGMVGFELWRAQNATGDAPKSPGIASRADG